MTRMLSGPTLLRDARYNKGTAFTEQERRLLKLDGLLPSHISTQDQQVKRCFDELDNCQTPFDKYIYMQSLSNRNQTLFFRVMQERLVDLMPIVYTPTVGEACQKFGHILRDTKGLYISLRQKGRIREVLENWPNRNVRGIVVTDGERILGLGDLGTFGMGIPIGKLQLYTACAGVDPNQLLPVCIDVGTNNQSLLADPLYTGLVQKRAGGQEYDEFIDEFVHAVKDKWGEHTLIQWEDFANHNAGRLLEKYQDTCCTFNDDMQGTASVTLAGILASNRISGKKLADHIVLLAGAGEAGLGIANLTAMALAEEAGISLQEARKSMYLVDSRGLITKDRPSGGISEEKSHFAHDCGKHIDNLTDAVKHLKPSILIGVTAKPGMFTEEIVKDMAANHEAPLIFPLSNPTSHAECTAEDAYKWTNGKCIFASGSPFQPVEWNGKTYVPGQGNNAYIFPGVALGILSTGARRVTDQHMLIAAKTLAGTVAQAEMDQGRVYPPLESIRKVSALIAAAVGEDVYRNNNATVFPEPSDMLKFMTDKQYDCKYPVYSCDHLNTHLVVTD
uniref:Malic enzyme n=2 Tax=Amphora coffeiformis TaxID=265554 RepID=A0A7S3P451_9STRA